MNLTFNSGNSSEGTGSFRSMETLGSLNLIRYLETNHELCSSSELVESMDLGMSDIWFESIRLLSLFSGTLFIPLADALYLENLVASLVTGPVGNGTICLPLFASSLCNGIFPVFCLITTLASS
jgi:hypothetical protein